MLFVGLLSLVLATSLATIGPQQIASPGYVMLTSLAPLQVWAVTWAISAIVCWIQAFMRQDRVAFALATAMWWFYGLAYLIGTFSGVNPRGWVLGGVWIAFGGWINLIATWPEASPTPKPPEVGHANPS